MATNEEKLEIQEKLIKEMSELIKIQREAINIMGEELEKTKVTAKATLNLLGTTLEIAKEDSNNAQSNIQHDRALDNPIAQDLD